MYASPAGNESHCQNKTGLYDGDTIESMCHGVALTNVR